MAGQEFSAASSPLDCTMHNIAIDYTTFNYTACDYLRIFSQKYSMLTRGTRLVSGNDDKSEGPPPAFLTDTTDIAVVEEFMTTYVKTTVSHFKDKIYAWDVVDEAVIDVESEPNVDGVRSDTVFGRVDDYICKSFKAAAEVDPAATLLLSDYGFESMAGFQKAKSDRVFYLAQHLRINDCKISGVAMKIRVDLNFDGTMIQGVRDNVARYFNDHQLFVQMTDIEVQCVYDAANPGECKQYNSEDQQKQAHIFGELLKICLEAPNCNYFGVMGLSEKYQPDHVHGLLFNEANEKKSSYFRLMSTIEEHAKKTPTLIQN